MNNLAQFAPPTDSHDHCWAAARGADVSWPKRAIHLARLWVAGILVSAAHKAAPSELNVKSPGCAFGLEMPNKRDLVTGCLNPTRSREVRYDRLYKSVGMTHRVQVRMLHEIGQAEVVFWMRNPSKRVISEVLQRRGVHHCYDTQLIEL